MKPWVRLLPCAVLLFILPFPGTVTLRLLALACALLVSAWSWHKDGFPQIPAWPALLFWAGLALLSLATAVDPGYTLGEIKNEIGYTMAAYLAFITLTRTRADAVFLLGALILGSLALASIALWDNLSSDLPRWNEDGLAGGSGSYSTYLLALLPALLWAGGALRLRHRWGLVAGLIALQLLVAVIAGQRQFWLVFALQVLVGLPLLSKRGFVELSTARMRAIGVLAVVLSALVIVGATARRDTISLGDDPRLSMWPGVAARIVEHPLTGKGFGREAMKKAYPELRSKKFPEVWHAHNLFLNYGLSMGVPGMLAALYLFFTLLRIFWKLSRAEDPVIAMAGISGVLLVLAVVVRNLSNDFFVRDLALLFWAIAGMLLGYASHAEKSPQIGKAPGA
ncbi:MAG: O-antigen ligase family protein [Burkholderiales bacterium]|nr:O-antigen ligase family protein [Burkholderiales bacterium]